tara:strand:+ start:2414 stop:3559 length:1146 start_codon:yes stop_codon:yes gene_type:complete
MKKKIAIIGAGIGGLTLANLLQENSNLEIKVYEREETLRLDEGFGIQLAVNSVSILNKIGFKDIDKNKIFNPNKLDFYSNKNKICNLDLTKFNSSDEKYTTLQRSVLIKFLKDKLYSNLLRFNKTLKKSEMIGDKIKITFNDNQIDEVDYLIVSDGVFSKTKEILENKITKPNYLGSIAFRFLISNDHQTYFNKNNISLVMSSNCHLVTYPTNLNDLNIVMIARTPESNLQKLQEDAHINNFLKNSILKDYLELARLENNNFKCWPIYFSQRAEMSKFKNVFYLGDAFYTFPPTMAQGASQSIEASMELSKIVKSNSMEKTKKYFVNRTRRSEIIIKRSKFNYFAFHLKNRVFIWFRNIILSRTIKNKKFIDIYLGRVFKK